MSEKTEKETGTPIRSRRVAIRLALGATGASAIRLVLRDAVAMIGVGIAIAIPCVASLGKLVQSPLFGAKRKKIAMAGARLNGALSSLLFSFLKSSARARIFKMVGGSPERGSQKH